MNALATLPDYQTTAPPVVAPGDDGVITLDDDDGRGNDSAPVDPRLHDIDWQSMLSTRTAANALLSRAQQCYCVAIALLTVAAPIEAAEDGDGSRAPTAGASGASGVPPNWAHLTGILLDDVVDVHDTACTAFLDLLCLLFEQVRSRPALPCRH